MPDTILVVDDDTTLARTVERVLLTAGYDVLLAYTAEDGVQLGAERAPDLVLLDVMVPSLGGWEVCRQLRSQSDVPIIFLTALADGDNVVHGLELGADDYVVKPFDPAELVARVKAHLRRARPADRGGLFSVGDGALELDTSRRTLLVEGAPVDLTPREFDLLAALARHRGDIVANADLARQAWQLEDPAAAENVKPYIHYLRQKIERDPASPRWILTVRGAGYRLAQK